MRSMSRAGSQHWLPRQRGQPTRGVALRNTSSMLVLALVLLLQSAAGTDAYGFDCGQGSAMLFLTSHSQCGSKAHMACFASLAMRVKKCQIKAWPHHPNSHHRPCWGLQLLATVSDVNSANGSLTILMHGSGRHISVPAQLAFSRPREAMLLVAGPCTMTFSAVPAPEDTLAPVPGEGRGALSSLVRLLVPAVLVPAVVVALLLVAGGRTPPAGTSSSSYDSSSSPGGGDAGAYHQLPDTPGPGGSGSSSSGSSSSMDDRPPCTSLLLRTFNLKAMSRRARARRLRRHTRPVYVGPPQPPPAGGLGRGCPGGPGGGLVAPCFRFPPVALPPGLEAIPEAVTPSSGSGPPSRASSSSDLDCDTRLLPAAVAATGAVGAPQQQQQQQQQQAVRAAGDAWLVGSGGGGAGPSGAPGCTGSSSSQPLSALHPWSRRVQQHSLKQQLMSQQFLSSLTAAAQPDCGDRLLLGAWFQQQEQWPLQSAAGLEPARQ